jgi:hypothetical protein
MSTKQGEMIVTRSFSPAYWRKPSELAPVMTTTLSLIPVMQFCFRLSRPKFAFQADRNDSARAARSLNSVHDAYR